MSDRLSLFRDGAVLLALLAANIHWAEPRYNWDLLGYLAVSLEIEGVPADEVPRRSYELASRGVPDSAFVLLTGSNAYRRAVAADVDAFSQQIPFYRVKPAYPAAITALRASGVEAVAASIILARAGYVLAGLLLLLWLRQPLSSAAAVGTTWAVMSLPVSLELARLSTPDALSTALLVAAFWIAHRGRRPERAVALLLLSLLVRPDNVVWLIALGAFSWIWLGMRHAAALGIALGVLLVSLLGHASDALSWSTLFYTSFVDRLVYPATFASPLGALDYLRVYLRESHPAHLPPFLMLHALLAGWLARARLRAYGWKDRSFGLLAAIAVGAAGHWLMYPDEDRFFVAGYMVITALLVEHLSAPSRKDAPP